MLRVRFWNVLMYSCRAELLLSAIYIYGLFIYIYLHIYIYIYVCIGICKYKAYMYMYILSSCVNKSMKALILAVCPTFPGLAVNAVKLELSYASKPSASECIRIYIHSIYQNLIYRSPKRGPKGARIVEPRFPPIPLPWRQSIPKGIPRLQF